MTEEQRQRWKDTGLFPLELWRTDADSTPLVCPLPDRAQLRTLAESIPAHIQASGWYATTRQRYDHRSVYADNFSGMGRQAIASVISAKAYSGPLADYIAAACPRAILAVLDRLDELERAVEHAYREGFRDAAALKHEDTAWMMSCSKQALSTPGATLATYGGEPS